MYFSYLSTIRAVLITPIMVSFFIWHSSWLPASISTILYYLIPTLAVVVVLNELFYILYLQRSFTRLHADVVPLEDSSDHHQAVKNYDVTFVYNGAPFTARFSETVLGSSLHGLASCRVLIQKQPPHMILIDGFKLRYMNLIFAFMLVYLVYYSLSNPSFSF